MNKTYKVTQNFINELKDWRDDFELNTQAGWAKAFVDGHSISNLPDVVENWWDDPDDSAECNERLIAIIQWLNGEDVFDVEAPHKFIVRSEKPDEYEAYTYVVVSRQGVTITSGYRSNATKFDTREEAQEWANSHQVIIEVDKNGKEV